MDRKDLAIGVLSTTAAILLVGLLLIQTQPQPVFASGMNTISGDYILLTGERALNREEVLYVVDTRRQGLIPYQLDLRGRQIAMGPPVDLSQLPTGDATKKRQPPRRGGRRQRN